MHKSSDDEIRSKVRALLLEAFALLSEHSHGDTRQGQALGQAQSSIAATVQTLDGIGP